MDSLANSIGLRSCEEATIRCPRWSLGSAPGTVLGLSDLVVLRWWGVLLYCVWFSAEGSLAGGFRMMSKMISWLSGWYWIPQHEHDGSPTSRCDSGPLNHRGQILGPSGTKLFWVWENISLASMWVFWTLRTHLMVEIFSSKKMTFFSTPLSALCLVQHRQELMLPHLACLHLPKSCFTINLMGSLLDHLTHAPVLLLWILHQTTLTCSYQEYVVILWVGTTPVNNPLCLREALHHLIDEHLVDVQYLGDLQSHHPCLYVFHNGGVLTPWCSRCCCGAN